MQIVYSPEYEVNLGAHPFVTAKYRLVKEKLIEENIFTEKDFVIPEIPDDDDILLVHTPEYFKKVKSVHLSSDEILRLEIPLTKEIAGAGVLCCGGTILSCMLAIETGAGIHLGGGFHHAFSDHGEGFCVFNDLAVAIRKMQKLNKIKKALVIDCDLHQGNGTAYIFQKDTNVFTFSIHQEDIYPYPKQRSNVDIELSAGSGDEEYLELLRKSVPSLIEKHKPEIILYQAGADPYKGDQLGQLKLTIDGLKKRDEFIFKQARTHDIPVAVTLGGGYALDTKDTVNIHTNTVRVFLKKPM